MAKKIKKVETPIDNRETFVSLQKSFAESDLSVEEKLKTLYELQKADSEIDKILQLRGELPVEVAALEEEIARLKGKIAERTTEIENMNTTIADSKQKMIEDEEQIAKYQQQLGGISNSREYDSIEKEIENLNLLKQIAEKVSTEAKQKILVAKGEIEGLKDRITICTDDLHIKKEELATIVESTSKEEEQLMAVREACAAKIDARTMSAYERIRQSVNNHLAVVSIVGGACGGCFNKITPQRLIDIASGKKLVICEHCGRIIINPNAE